MPSRKKRGRRIRKESIIMNALKRMAVEKGYSKNKICKITNYELWNYLLKNNKTKFLTEPSMKTIRKGLPKMYRDEADE